ncbi:exodeoxyribonuclease III [Parendozoicomonas haliclonae]|uniref:Exodeoxyribonuclease III n=1 Tax=Parendozoicomonas haliclonae TaxID=1960125 RepID=A0A1X7AKG6_9GAMM|nr:exodeoxyribonuclease III [Parendozoicomonas haliclonae]SMA47877.1 Exodeoxyribonuclease III [Parendozoicomonas haliclonae]
MRIVSFNANSIRTRLHQIEAIIARHDPDVIAIQETKVSDEEFPVEAITALGYHVSFHGQKTHYGVATLTKEKPLSVIKGFPGEPEGRQKRMIMVDLPWQGSTIKVINGYFPQGENREHPEKFANKTWFYQALQDYLTGQCSASDPVVVLGDFNISPQDTDIGIGADNAKRWLKTGKCSFLPEEREWYQRLLGWGLTDSYRHLYPDNSDLFSWFDYRSKGFEREPKRGLRIDHILVTQPLLANCSAAGVDYEIRGMEKPSDHAPVWVQL